MVPAVGDLTAPLTSQANQACPALNTINKETAYTLKRVHVKLCHELFAYTVTLILVFSGRKKTPLFVVSFVTVLRINQVRLF